MQFESLWKIWIAISSVQITEKNYVEARWITAFSSIGKAIPLENLDFQVSWAVGYGGENDFYTVFEFMY